MRKFFYALVTMSLVGATTAAAQVRSEVEVLRQEIRTDRQAVVAKNLPMSEAQAAAFWPAYREYRAEVTAVGDRMVTLITNYSKQYKTMKDADAEPMLKEWLDIQEAQVKVRSKNVARFKKILPAASVARFYQIENKMDAIMNVELAAGIPLVP